jgi:subtilase family serine protease
LDSSGNWSLVNKADFTIIPATIVVDSVNSILCAGTGFDFHYTLNGTFNAANVLTVQLSDSSGSFANPLNIASKTSNTSDTIAAFVPAHVATGSQYRIRIVSSLPADTSAANAVPLTVKRLPDQPFSIVGPELSCADTQIYHLSPVQQQVQYTWQVASGGSLLGTGGDSSRVLWNAAGTHYLRLVSSNVCGNGYRDSLEVKVFSTPPAAQPLITVSGNWLHAPALPAAAGAMGYQWYRDSTIISGAVDSFLQILGNGQYTVKYTNPCGTGPASAAVTVAKLPQTIAFASLPDRTFGDAPFLLAATASSSLPVTFNVVSGPASISGDTVFINGAGLVAIQADQAGDSTYYPADSVRQAFTVHRAPQTISFNAIPDKTYGDSAFALVAIASTGLPLTFSVASGPATVSGDTVSLIGAGPVTITAMQAGNQNYLPAQHQQNFCISPVPPDTILGYKVTCVSTQRYYIDSIPGTAYTWALSGGGSLHTNTGGAVDVTWTANGIDTLFVTPAAGCSTPVPAQKLVVQVGLQTAAGIVSNMVPADSAILSAFPALFSWMPGSNSQLFDLYIWPADSAMPAQPTISNLFSIGYAVGHQMLAGFSAGKRYYWKVRSKNACSQTTGPVQTFTISNLPDLTVPSLNAPAGVSSGQNISVSYTVRNNGLEDTRSVQWPDHLYLSVDSVLSKGLDIYLGGAFNLSALDTGDSYNSTLQVHIPDSLSGSYYLIVEANSSRALAESNFDNNSRVRPISITLTPTADLQVTSVTSTSAAFSGQPISITYGVRNLGAGSTSVGAWKDHLFLSPSVVFNAGQSLKIGEVSYVSGKLQPNGSYTRTITVTLPPQVFGQHYLHVVTDAANQVFEFAAENNNSAGSDSLILYLTPPPDYVPQAYTVPAAATNGGILHPDWIIKNEGAARQAADSVWIDRLFAGTDSNIARASRLADVPPPLVPHALCSQFSLGAGGCRYVTPAMLNEGTYSNAATVTLPLVAADSIYLFLFTDAANHLFEHQQEGNNVLRRKIRLLHPDLVVDTVTAPATGSAGQPFMLSWKVSNAGPGKVMGNNRADYVYLSPTQVFNTATAILVGTATTNTSLDSGASLLRRQSFTLPSGISGLYYVFVAADGGNSIYEGANEHNNRNGSSSPILITIPPAPDLQVSQIVLGEDTVTAPKNITIAYQVVNNGPGDVLGHSWKDRIYVSRQPVWDTNTAVLIKTISRSQTLPVNNSYTVVDSLPVTMALLHSLQADSVPVYVYVQTDAGNNVIEGTGEGNNRLRSSPLFAMQGPRPDLTVLSVTAPAAVNPGDALQITYSVQNLGAPTGAVNSYWIDRAYLSSDTVLSAQDQFLAQVTRYAPLAANGVYNGALNCKAPMGVSGYHYVLLVTDQEDLQADANRLNNYNTVRRAGNVAIPMYISPLGPSDLVIENFQSPTLAYAGQPLMLKWRTKNIGTDTTSALAWTERAFLSFDTVVSAQDITIGSYSRNGILAPGAHYDDSLSAWVSATLNGNFYLLFKADVNNSVYEPNAEANNTFARLIQITPQPQSDLIVEDIAMDSAVAVDDSLVVGFEVRNIGLNAAMGSYRAGIYISPDSVLSNNDVLLANPLLTANLAPLAAASYSQKVRMRGLIPGPYYVLVKADLNNSIPEVSETNNTGASIATINVSMARLPIDTLVSGTLANGKDQYWQIIVPDSLEGLTLMITLQGDSLHAHNELYASPNAVPDRARHRFAASQPLGANQQLVIPELQKGAYYLLVYGNTSAASQQPITLLAQRVNFGIHSIATNKGGNTGFVTSRIRGAKFEPGMAVRITDPVLGTVTASKVSFTNSTTAYVTFPLAGTPLGVYDVRVVKPGQDSAVLPDGFTVEPGTGTVTGGGGIGGGFYCNISNEGVDELLVTTLSGPHIAAPFRPVNITVLYGNSGNVDIPIPQLRMVSLTNDPLASYPVISTAVSTTTLGSAYVVLEDLAREVVFDLDVGEGPPGILMPGTQGSVTVYTLGTLAHKKMQFRLIATGK